MKAILVKLLPATNTLPARLKVSADQVQSQTYPTCSGLFTNNSIDCIELQAVKRFILNNNLNWLDKNNLVIGQLPNGDHAAVLVAK